MRKLNKILLGALSILTLGLFVGTGAKVNAATSYVDSHDYAYKGSDFYSGSVSTNTQNLTSTGIVSFTGKYYPYDSTSGEGKYFTSNKTGETFDFLLVSGGGSRTIVINNTANTQELDVTVFMVWIANKKGITITNANDIVMTHDDKATTVDLTDGTKYTPDFSSEVCKVQTITFTIDAGESTTITPESNVGLLGLYGDKVGSTSTKEELAVAAIDDIGTVTYTEECAALIATATQKVNACTNGITDIQAYDTTNSTSYATTYSNALSSFATLKSAAISNFTTAVSNIGTVTASSGTAISSAKAAYAVLFGDALTDTDVVTSKATLDSKVSVYDNLMYESYDKTINASDCEDSDGITSKTQAANSIFYLLPTCKVNSTSVTYDEVSYTKRIQTGGNVAFSGNNVSNKAVEFETKSAGTLKILAQSAKSTDTSRTLSVYKKGSTSAIYTSESGLPGTTSEIEYMYIDIPSADTYYVGSSVNNISIYYMEFIPEKAVEVTALQQEAVVDGSTFVRFIFTVSNNTELNSSDFEKSLTLILDQGEGQRTVTASPKAYNKLTLNGETLTNGTYQFDNSVNTNDIYVVYVVEFTTATYLGHTINASLTYGSNTYTTTPYEFK